VAVSFIGGGNWRKPLTCLKIFNQAISMLGAIYFDPSFVFYQHHISKTLYFKILEEIYLILRHT